MNAVTIKALAEAARDLAYCDACAALQGQAQWYEQQRDPEKAAAMRCAAAIVSRRMSLDPISVVQHAGTIVARMDLHEPERPAATPPAQELVR